VICSEIKCEGCLLPYSNDKIFDYIISRYPNSDTGMIIDNTYLYLSESQRKYQVSWNRDFSLELTWLKDWYQEVHNLNEKVDHDFKLQKTNFSNGISIYNCFKIFIKLEKLEDMNEWYCSKCKSHQKATKKMEIYKSPHILIIHLKRFKNINKLDCPVDYPIVDLDLTPYVINNEENLPLLYDLFAVSNHVGNMGFGHYFAFCKNPVSGQWYRLDDSTVTPLSQKDVVSQHAYVLFYRRRNLENIIDLEELYKKKFINYYSQLQNIEAHFQSLSNINIFNLK
jgi:hypothetical protein